MQVVYLRGNPGKQTEEMSSRKGNPSGMCYPMGKLTLSTSSEPFRVCRTHLTTVPLESQKAEVFPHPFLGVSGSNLPAMQESHGFNP